MLNDRSSPATLVATRRSGKPRDMVAPGPSSEQMARILTAAMRVPDHGKLAPWRFVVVADDRREAFAAMLQDAWRAERGTPDSADVAAIEQFAHQSPALVVVLSTPDREAKIPLWEQELSAGAACTMMLTAAHAEGYVGSWLTGWAAFSPHVREALGHPDGKVAGFLFFGTPGRALEERPRPSYDSIVSRF